MSFSPPPTLSPRNDNLCSECQQLSYGQQYDRNFGQRSTGHQEEMLRQMFDYCLTQLTLKNCMRKHDARHCFFHVDLTEDAPEDEEDVARLNDDNFQRRHSRRSRIYRPMDLDTMINHKAANDECAPKRVYGSTMQLLFDMNLVYNWFNLVYYLFANQFEILKVSFFPADVPQHQGGLPA